MLEDIRNIHFVGIGGYGMSALAKILVQKGFSVSGSDLKENSLTLGLRQMGARICIGEHKVSNVAGCQMIVYSSAIKMDNPEILYANENSIPLIHRVELLSFIAHGKTTIVIAGAHGKTTTTSLSSMLLLENGLSPTVIIGGEVEGFNGNAILGKGRYLVCESDESDGSFLKINSDIAIVTNIDKEHMDYYKTMQDVVSSYKKFIENIKPDGVLIGCADNDFLLSILHSFKKKLTTYGLSKYANIRAESINTNRAHSSYICIADGKTLGEVHLSIPGVHNIVNSLAVVGLGIYLQIPFKNIVKALSRYYGAKRRFQIKIDGDILVVDDYAHHPNEIIATLKAAKSWGRRIVAVFQPHRYTRVYSLKNEFANCFSDVDLLILTDIYAASEEPIDSIDGYTICAAVNDAGKKAMYVERQRVLEALLDVVKSRDFVLILGAGDITNVSDEFVDVLKSKQLYNTI
jgi:UDP-N-acetylmuramate--alanine ligase